MKILFLKKPKTSKRVDGVSVYAGGGRGEGLRTLSAYIYPIYVVEQLDS